MGLTIKALGVPFKALEGPCKAPVFEVRSGRFQNGFGKSLYDKAPGGPYTTLGGLATPLGPLGPYKALGILMGPLETLWLEPLGSL